MSAAEEQKPVVQPRLEVDTSQARGEFAQALAKAQSQMGSAKKDSRNPHFDSKYADLASVWDACREPLTQNGFAVVQLPNSLPDGVVVETVLIHSSGQQMRSRCWLPVEKKTPQAYGSAITYARRYALAAMAGVVADEDDDGNAASQPRQSARDERRPPKRYEAPKASEPDASSLEEGKRAGIPLAEFSVAELESTARSVLEFLERNPKHTKAPALRRDSAKLNAELSARMASKP